MNDLLQSVGPRPPFTPSKGPIETGAVRSRAKTGPHRQRVVGLRAAVAMPFQIAAVNDERSVDKPAHAGVAEYLIPSDPVGGISMRPFYDIRCELTRRPLIAEGEQDVELFA